MATDLPRGLEPCRARRQRMIPINVQCERPAVQGRRCACSCARFPAGPAVAEGTVNIYTYRQPDLIKPVLDAFTAKTGIQTQVLFLDKGLEERVAAEGENSPADVIMTVDISRLDRRQGKGHPAAAGRRDDQQEHLGRISRSRRRLVRRHQARPRHLCVEGSGQGGRTSPTPISPIPSGRAASASAPASTTTTSRCSPR